MTPALSLPRPVIFIFIAFILGLALSGEAAELRTRFRAWTATCGGDRYCTASTRLRSSEADQTYAFQLRVSRFDSGAREIAFLPAGDRPADDTALSVQVDSQPPLTLQPGSGYRPVGRSNTYVVADPKLTSTIVDAMRDGKRVRFSYRSTLGKQVEALFPLDGFAAALAIVDPRPRAAALERPPVEPAPLDEARSVEPAPRDKPPPVEPVVETVATQVEPQPVPEKTPRVGGPPPGRKRVKAVRQFACLGNEPPWNLVIDKDKGRFALLAGTDEPVIIELSGKLRVTGEGRTPDVDWRAKAADGRAYRALVQQQSCAGPMSDAQSQTRFEYRVQLTVPGGRTLRGCCNAGLELPNAAGAEPPDLAQAPVADLSIRAPSDWSRWLMDLLPAIQACLDKTPGAVTYVTKAWPMNRGMVGVRTRNATVGWFECVAQSDGRVVERFGPVESNAPPIPGEEAVLFTPSAQTPLPGNCFTHERVVDANGHPIGWLSTNECAAAGRVSLDR